MAIYCYTTENCQLEAQTHGWQDRLASFAKDIEQKQTVRMFDHFPPPYLVKKKFGEYAGRLIAAHVAVGEGREDSVVVLLSAMIRGSAAYEAFSDDAVKYGKAHLEEDYLLKAATTDAEVQKLQGVLVGLSAALNNTDYEINQATASALVQDIANRNDAQRQVQAQKQQQDAEFTEALQKYGQTFKLMNAPTAFPTQ